MTGAEQALLRHVDEVLSECRKCIAPALPNDLFDLHVGGGAPKIKFGRYEFAIDPDCATAGRSLSDQVVDAFTRLLPFVRRGLMHDAAPNNLDAVPHWLFTTHEIVAHWLAATGAVHELIAASKGKKVWTLSTVRFGLRSKSRPSRLNGQAYCGYVGGTLILSDKIHGIFTGDRHVASLVVDHGAFPEAYLWQLAKRLTNGPVPFCDVVSDSILDGFPVMIAAIKRQRASVLLDLEPRCQTLAPVPECAMQLAPVDCNPAAPWDLTVGEAARLRVLSGE